MSTYRHTLSASDHAKQVERHLRLLVGLTYAASQEASRRQSTGDESWKTWTPLAESALNCWISGCALGTLEQLARLDQRADAYSVHRTIAEIRAQIEPRPDKAATGRFKAALAQLTSALGFSDEQTEQIA